MSAHVAASPGPAGRPKQGYELLEMEPDRGTAVFAFNTTERAGPDAGDSIASGAADSLRGTGRDQAPIDIGGEEGTLVEAPDGAFIAISPAGDCSFAVLIADTERMLRDGAALIPSG